jgi:hypothetical protein
MIPANAPDIALSRPPGGRDVPAEIASEPLAQQKPLGPILTLNVNIIEHKLDGTDSDDSTVATALWQNYLLGRSFLLTDDNSGIPGYSLTVTGESHASSQIAGLYTVAVMPLTAKLCDSTGKILAVELLTSSDPLCTRAGTEEEGAYEQAMEASVNVLITKLTKPFDAAISAGQ